MTSVDGTDGNFPSDNLITRNHFHENGVLTKQSSPYFQTVACHNNITFNVMYNGPRAGINLNDGCKCTSDPALLRLRTTLVHDSIY